MSQSENYSDIKSRLEEMSEFELEEFDEALLDFLREKNDYVGVSVTDPERVNHIASVFKAVKKFAKNSGAKAECYLNKPRKSMGYISLTGKDVSFKNPIWLVKAIELSSNFEIYAKTDGSVEANFAFHGLTKGFKEEIN